MNTIARTTTLRRVITSYQHLDKTAKEGRRWRAFSTRRTPAFGRLNYGTAASPDYQKFDRARRRHVFLQGYELSMYATKEKLRSEIKLKKAMVKVKRMVVSVISFMRAASLNKCNSKSAIDVASATPVHRCF